MRQLKITQQITARETLALNKYLQEIGAIPLLSMEEELTLPAKMAMGDEKARKRFIEGNLRFVISVAKQYQNRGEKLDDLVNAGNLGLINAAEKFDVSRGFKFISYAVWWVRQSILQYLGENGKAIRLPANKIVLVNKIKNTIARLEQQLQRTPTSEEICDLINIDEENKTNKKKIEVLTPEDIEHAITMGGAINSIDVKLGEDSDMPMSDTLIGEADVDITKILRNRDLENVLTKMFKQKLTDREQQVIKHFFGILSHEQRSLDEIGETMDLTRERVRQIKEKALRKLKNNSASKELQEYA